MTNKISGLVKKAILPLAAVGVLSGCSIDTPHVVKVKEYSLGEGKSRIEILKNVVALSDDYYTINVYGCDGNLTCSIVDSHMSDNNFIIKEDSLKRNVSGLEILGNN